MKHHNPDITKKVGKHHIGDSDEMIMKHQTIEGILEEFDEIDCDPADQKIGVKVRLLCDLIHASGAAREDHSKLKSTLIDCMKLYVRSQLNQFLDYLEGEEKNPYESYSSARKTGFNEAIREQNKKIQEVRK